MCSLMTSHLLKLSNLVVIVASCGNEFYRLMTDILYHVEIDLCIDCSADPGYKAGKREKVHVHLTDALPHLYHILQHDQFCIVSDWIQVGL